MTSSQTDATTNVTTTTHTVSLKDSYPVRSSMPPPRLVEGRYLSSSTSSIMATKTIDEQPVSVEKMREKYLSAVQSTTPTAIISTPPAPRRMKSSNLTASSSSNVSKKIEHNSLVPLAKRRETTKVTSDDSTPHSSTSIFTPPRLIKGSYLSTSAPNLGFSTKKTEGNTLAIAAEKQKPSISPLNASTPAAKRELEATVNHEKMRACITIPIDLFIKKVIDVETLSCSAWKERIFAELTLQVNVRLKETELLSDEDAKEIVDTILASSLRFSSIIPRIKQAASFLSEIKEFAFLKKFQFYYDPLVFWAKYQALNLQQKKILGPIAGLTFEKRPFEVNKSLGKPRKMLEMECQTHIQSFLRAHTVESNREPQQVKLLSFIAEFQVGFDRSQEWIKLPLRFIQFEDIRDSFRRFWTKEKLNITLLVLNGEKIEKPSYNKIEEDDRPDYLLKYLIRVLNSKLEKNDQKQNTSSALPFKIEEITQTCLKFMELNAKIEPSTVVTKEKVLQLANYFTQELGAKQLANILKHYSSFCQQALNEAIQTYPNSMEKQVKFFCQTIYPRLFILRRAEKEIACLRLLQALSFSAYTPAELFMRKILCPELQIEQEGNYHIKYSPLKPTRHSVRFDIEKEDFLVTHIKPYTISSIAGGKKREKVANVIVHWTIKGNLQSTDFSAQFRIAEIRFKEKILLEERLEILKKFNIEWTTAPWQGYVSTSLI